MATPDEIARESADALVSLTGPANVEYGVRVGAGRVSVTCWLTGREKTEKQVAAMKETLAKAVLAAIERALREVPVPSPVSGERLAHVRTQNAARADEWGHSAETLVIDQLLAHADHLTRLLQDCAADGTLARMQELREAGRLEGFREGAQAQRALDVEAARSQLTGWGADCEDCVTGVSVAMQAVADAPLAAPPAG